MLAPGAHIEGARAPGAETLRSQIDFDPVRVLVAALDTAANGSVVCGDTEDAARAKVLLAAIKDGLACETGKPFDRQIGHMVMFVCCTLSICCPTSKRRCQLYWRKPFGVRNADSDLCRLNALGIPTRQTGNREVPFTSTPHARRQSGERLFEPRGLYPVLIWRSKTS